jgi:hypothetical protein
MPSHLSSSAQRSRAPAGGRPHSSNIGARRRGRDSRGAAVRRIASQPTSITLWVYANVRSVTSQGSAHSRFQRALKTGNLTLIRNAAAELPRVDLGDALAVCVAIHKAEPEHYERATLRWLARYCLERREATLAHVRTAAWAFDNLADDPAALETLERLCSR